MKFTKTAVSKFGFLFASLGLVAGLTACGGGSNNSNPGGNTTPTMAITSNSGYTTSAATGGSFGTFAVTVTSNGSPASGVSVTFTAPSSGASGTFADNGAPAAADTETTNSSGVARSTVFTANNTAGSYTVTATVSGATTPASFNLTNSSAAAITIAATSGGGQTATVGRAFTKPFVATVMQGSTPVSGASVTFTAPNSGASGLFADGGTPAVTDTETTNSSGVATSTVFSANSTSGSYSVTAATSGASTAATFSLSNAAVTSSNTLTATSGGGQTATTGQAFANPLVATVTNSGGDPVSGVSVTFAAPSTGASGSFADGGSPAITDTEITGANGQATSTVFTANSIVGAYNATASASGLTSVTFGLTNAMATISTGNYVFYMSGWNTNPSPYYLAGEIQIVNGVIQGGEQDFVEDQNFAVNDLINPSGSSLTTTADGNLQLVLVTCDGGTCTSTDPNVGVNGSETFNVSLRPLNPNKGFINEYDSFGSASGEIDLQNAVAASTTPAAGYAFSVGGLDAGGNFLAIGGVIDVDDLGNTVGTISGAGSIFDANDDFSGTTYQGQTFGAGTVSGPDSFGRVEFTLNPTDSTDFPQIIFAGYIVDSNMVRLVETADSYLGTTGGSARSQGSNTGLFSAASLSGASYVTALNGYDTYFVLQTAGVLTANSGGNVSGFIDFNDLSGSETTIPDPVSATAYTVDSTGRVTISGLTDGTISVNLQLYLDGNGQARVITMDPGDALSGFALQQSGTGTLSDANFIGSYGQVITGWDGDFDGEFDAVGTITAMGTGDTSSGFVDLNWLFSGSPTFTGVPITGAYTYTSSFSGDGLLTPASITGVDLLTCPTFGVGTTACSTDAFDYYLIDTTGDAVSIETDTNQLSFGYNAQ